MGKNMMAQPAKLNTPRLVGGALAEEDDDGATGEAEHVAVGGDALAEEDDDGATGEAEHAAVGRDALAEGDDDSADRAIGGEGAHVGPSSRATSCRSAAVATGEMCRTKAAAISNWPRRRLVEGDNWSLRIREAACRPW